MAIFLLEGERAEKFLGENSRNTGERRPPYQSSIKKKKKHDAKGSQCPALGRKKENGPELYS